MINVIGFFFIFLLAGCREEKIRIRLATTTSLANSGILSFLFSEFERTHKIKVDIIAVGTGAALKLGKNGDCDLVFVHSEEDEIAFVKEGFGVNRKTVMKNNFVLLGPKDDPANLKGKALLDGLRSISENKFPFVSRGDNSGTHKKELSLWKMANIKPSGSWYIQTGQGMGQTLIIADEKNAYCLCDTGTMVAFSDKISLVVLKELNSNPYSIIAINQKKHPHVKYKEADILINWLLSEKTQRLIGNYKIKGHRLFNPISGSI